MPFGFREQVRLHGGWIDCNVSASEGIKTGVTWVVGRAEQTNRAKSAPTN